MSLLSILINWLIKSIDIKKNKKNETLNFWQSNIHSVYLTNYISFKIIIH